MKIFKIILKVFLLIFITILTLSFCVENIASKTLSEQLISRRISNYVFTAMLEGYDINKLDKSEMQKFYDIAEKVEKSKYIYNISLKTLQSLNKSEQINFVKEFNKIIDKNITDASEKNKTEILKYAKEYSNDVNEIKTHFILSSYKITILVNIYCLFTNTIFRIALFVLLLICLILLIIFNKSQFINSLEFSLIFSGIVSLILFGVLKISSIFLDQRIFGGRIHGLSTNMLLIISILQLFIGILLQVFTKRKLLKSTAK